jgi:hypothetical protein
MTHTLSHSQTRDILTHSLTHLEVGPKSFDEFIFGYAQARHVASPGQALLRIAVWGACGCNVM